MLNFLGSLDLHIKKFTYMLNFLGLLDLSAKGFVASMHFYKRFKYMLTYSG